MFSIRIGLFWKWETIFDWPLFKTFYKDKGRKWFYARQCICKMIDCLFIVWDLWDCKKASLACHRRIATPNHTTHVQNGHSCWEGNITRFENQSLPFVDKKCDKNRDKHKEERTKINSTRERQKSTHYLGSCWNTRRRVERIRWREWYVYSEANNISGNADRRIWFTCLFEERQTVIA